MEMFTLKRVHYNKCIRKETHKLPDSRRDLVIQLNICITQATRQSNLKTGINIQLNFYPNMAWVSKSCQKYVCDKRGKQFTEKHNLTRHIKTHVQCSQTYSCNICGK